MVGATTEKLLEPKHVWTRSTDSRLVSDEHNVHATPCRILRTDRSIPVFNPF